LPFSLSILVASVPNSATTGNCNRIRSGMFLKEIGFNSFLCQWKLTRITDFPQTGGGQILALRKPRRSPWRANYLQYVQCHRRAVNQIAGGCCQLDCVVARRRACRTPSATAPTTTRDAEGGQNYSGPHGHPEASSGCHQNCRNSRNKKQEDP
jgi:hypothetical protein